MMERWEYQPASDQGLTAAQRWRSVRREPGLVQASMQCLCQSIIAGYLRGFHRLQISGREHLPDRPPFVMVANLASHLDALTLACALPMRWRSLAFPIAAGDTFFRTSAQSFVSAITLNALPLWRDNCGPHAMRDLQQRLTRHGCVYILFPEGTRSRTGRMAPFKPGIGMLLGGAGVPVLPCRLRGTFEALPPDRRFPRAGRVRLAIGPAMSFADLPDRKAGWIEIASRLEQAIGAL